MNNNKITPADILDVASTQLGIAGVGTNILTSAARSTVESQHQNTSNKDELLSIINNEKHFFQEPKIDDNTVMKPNPKSGFTEGVKTGWDKFAKIVTQDPTFRINESEGIMAAIGETIGNPLLASTLVAPMGGIIASSVGFATVDTLSNYMAEKVSNPDNAEFDYTKFGIEATAGIGLGYTVKGLAHVFKPQIDNATGLLSGWINGAKDRIFSSPQAVGTAKALDKNILPTIDGDINVTAKTGVTPVKSPEVSVELQSLINNKHNTKETKDLLMNMATKDTSSVFQNSIKDFDAKMLQDEILSIQQAKRLYNNYDTPDDMLLAYKLTTDEQHVNIRHIMNNSIDDVAMKSEGLSDDVTRLMLRYSQKRQGWDIIDGVPMNESQLATAKRWGEAQKGMSDYIVKQANLTGGDMGLIEGYLIRNYSLDNMLKYNDSELYQIFNQLGARDKNTGESLSFEYVKHIKDEIITNKNSGSLNVLPTTKERKIVFDNIDGEYMFNKIFGTYQAPVDVLNQMAKTGSKKISNSRFFGSQDDVNTTLKHYSNMAPESSLADFRNSYDRLKNEVVNTKELPIDDVWRTIAGGLNTLTSIDKLKTSILNPLRFFGFTPEDSFTQLGNVLNEYGLSNVVRKTMNNEWVGIADGISYSRKLSHDYIGKGMDVERISSPSDRVLVRVDKAVQNMLKYQSKIGFSDLADKTVQAMRTVVDQSFMVDAISQGKSIAGVPNDILKKMIDNNGRLSPEVLSPEIESLAVSRDKLKDQFHISMENYTKIADNEHEVFNKLYEDLDKQVKAQEVSTNDSTAKAVGKIKDLNISIQSLDKEIKDLSKIKDPFLVNKLKDDIVLYKEFKTNSMKDLLDYNSEKAILQSKLNGASKVEKNNLKADIYVLDEQIKHATNSLNEADKLITKTSIDLKNAPVQKDLIGDIIKQKKDLIAERDAHIKNMNKDKGVLSSYIKEHTNKIKKLEKQYKENYLNEANKTKYQIMALNEKIRTNQLYVDKIKTELLRRQNEVIPVTRTSNKSFGGLPAKIINLRQVSWVMDVWKQSQYKILKQATYNLRNKNWQPFFNNQLPAIAVNSLGMGSILTIFDILRNPDEVKTGGDAALKFAKNAGIGAFIGGLYLPAIASYSTGKFAYNITKDLMNNDSEKLKKHLKNSSYLIRLTSMFGNIMDNGEDGSLK